MMNFQYIPYIWPLLISALTTLILGVYALIRQHHSKCTISFFISMLIVTIWSGGNALEMSGSDFDTKLFWANIQYFSYCYSPVALLALCMRFTGYDRWLHSRKFLWLLPIPTIIFILVWTDRFHGLIRCSMNLDKSSAFPVIFKNYGPLFYVHVIYEHIINITSLIMLIIAMLHRKTIYRKQAIILLIGASLIVFPNLFYITGLSPVKQFDLTPVFFGPAGALVTWAIFRYKMFDLVPFARTTVIETMDAGLMVLDLQGRILDINPAFETIMSTSAKNSAGKQANEIFYKIPEFSLACNNHPIMRTEFTIKKDTQIHIFEAVFSPLSDSKGHSIGRLVMVYEITEKKKAQQQYLEQQRRIAASNEKERMARDLHDSLGQVLGFINLQTQGIQQELRLAGVNTVNDKLDRLIEVTQAAHDEIRAYIRSARNISDIDKDFLESLRNDCLHFEQLSGISTELVTNIDLRDLNLEPQTQLHLLSIAKEALNNVLKHSMANYVKLSLILKGKNLFLDIEDNGKGFIITDTDQQKMFGLSIMKERALEIGAKLTIESMPEKGCRISLTLPIIQGENEL